jgi:glycosyltransferase involved in cell wall biosynthesis
VSVPHRIREVGLRNALRMAPRFMLDYMGLREYLPPVAYHTTRLMCRDTYMRQVLAQCDVLLAPSRFLRARYAAWGVPAERIQFIQNGVDPTKFTGLERTLPNGPALRAVYMGSILYHKGLDVLIDAFNQLTDVPVELAIYGGLNSNHWVKHYADTLRSRNRNPKVAFKGSFPNQEVARVLAEADVVIVPSILYENCPMVIQEALYAGRPVICSNVGGMAELIQDGVNGLTFRVGDAGHLAEKVRLLAQDRERLLALQRGITPPDSMEAVTAHVEGVYQRLLEARAAEQG